MRWGPRELRRVRNMTSGQAARMICCGAMLADPSRPLRDKGRNNKTPGRRQLCCQRAKIPRSRSTLSHTGSCPMSASMFIPFGHGDGTRASTRANGMPSAAEIVRSSSRSAGVTPRARRPRTVISRSTACSHCPADAELATCRNVPAGRRSQYRPDRSASKRPALGAAPVSPAHHGPDSANVWSSDRQQGEQTKMPSPREPSPSPVRSCTPVRP
jgi:hypothetical protein